MAAEIHALREEIDALKIQNASQNKLSVYKHPHQAAQPNSQRKCYNCSNPYPHAIDCQARNQICHICGKRNHFAKGCRSTRIPPGQRHPLNQLEQHEVYADTPPIHGNSVKLKQFKTTLKLNSINVPFLNY